MQQREAPDGATPARWRRRSLGAGALRAAVLCAPVATSFAAAWGVHRQLPPVGSHLDRVWHLVVLVAVSTVVLVVVDRVSRRLLPLVTLLDLSMLFPDRAPSRIRVAREAIRRRPIEEQLERVRDAGADPGAVAREILTLVAALSAHDKPTRGHAERVRMFTDLLAEQMGLPCRDRDLLRWAAILHDVGKLRVPTTLLNKPGKPTEDEWAVLKAHPGHGAEMAAGLLPWLGEWADVIVQHHERYDGTGYPSGLGGARISLGARIVSVADAYDVMTAARAYKRPVSRAAALKELVRFSGTQFDPQVVRAMVAVGAPRLRRTQGVVAWLADVPLVAGAVPASTLARVVGASALATSAVATGTTAMAMPAATPTARVVTSATSSAPAAGGHGRPAASHGPARADADRAADPRVDAPDQAAPADPGQSTAAVPTAAPDAPVGAGGDADTMATPPVDIATPAVSSTSPTQQQPGSGSTTPVTDPVKGTVKEATGAVGTVTGTVKGTVGSVTSTVDDVTSDPVGTVTGTLQDPVGTVDDTVGTVTGTVGSVVEGATGAAGSLLGGGSSGSGGSNSGPGSSSSGPGPSPSPSPSGTSSSGKGSGGLLGSLLGH